MEILVRSVRSRPPIVPVLWLVIVAPLALLILLGSGSTLGAPPTTGSPSSAAATALTTLPSSPVDPEETGCPSAAPSAEASVSPPSVNPAPGGSSSVPLASDLPPTPSASPAVTPDPSAVPLPSPAVSTQPSPSAASGPCATGTGIASGGFEASRGSVPSTTASPSPSTTASPPPHPTLSPTPTPQPTNRPRKPGKVMVARDVAFTTRQPCAEFRAGCIDRADIYYPSNRGPWPVVVTLHGRPRTPADMAPLARALAAKGAVVYNVDYRGVRPVSKGFPESIIDIACAVRFARTTADLYGGNGGHLVLVGHSQGGYVGAMVSLAGNTFPGRSGTCLAVGGSPLPDGFVSVAGVTTNHGLSKLDQIYFGGTPAEVPDAWRRGSLYRRIGGNDDLVVGIIFERQDPYLGVGHATRFYNALDRAGYDCLLVLLDDGTTHFDILDTTTPMGQQVEDLVWRVIRRSRDNARGAER